MTFEKFFDRFTEWAWANIGKNKMYPISNQDRLAIAHFFYFELFPDKKPKDKYNPKCECTHNHNDHIASESVNYSAGICRVCNCKHFIIK